MKKILSTVILILIMFFLSSCTSNDIKCSELKITDIHDKTTVYKEESYYVSIVEYRSNDSDILYTTFIPKDDINNYSIINLHDKNYKYYEIIGSIIVTRDLYYNEKAREAKYVYNIVKYDKNDSYGMDFERAYKIATTKDILWEKQPHPDNYESVVKLKTEDFFKLPYTEKFLHSKDCKVTYTNKQ